MQAEDEETPRVKPEVLALSDKELDLTEINFYRGLFGDYEMRRLLETARIQRTVLRTLFSYWTNVPLRIISTADPVRSATLAELKRHVSMEDDQ